MSALAVQFVTFFLVGAGLWTGFLLLTFWLFGRAARRSVAERTRWQNRVSRHVLRRAV